MNTLHTVLDALNEILWGPVVVAVMAAAGIYLSVKTKFFQITKFHKILKHTLGSLFEKQRDKNKISPFQAVTTALAGTIGTGNIAGVATAIVAGGPGAVFWMWISGIIGMMLKYAEVVLAVKYRKTCKDGSFRAGPMYYMKYGLNMPVLGSLFAFICVLASFGSGNVVQSNSIAQSMLGAFNIPVYITGAFVAAVCALVLLGSAKRIARATEFIVPFMAVFYVVGSFIFLWINRNAIGNAVNSIFSGAFSSKGIFGGVYGFSVKKAVQYGMSRGIFTNEAGMGSASIVHGEADCKSPAHQGMWGIFEVFFDTIFICTITALVILTSAKNVPAGLDGAELTVAAFSTVFGSSGEYFIAVAVLFFAVASILGWAFYGQRSLEFLFGENSRIITIYKIIFILFIFAGSVMSLQTVWSLSDVLNGLMLVPNLAVIIVMSKEVINVKRNF